MEIIETEFEEVEAFLYTSKNDNKYLAVDKDIEESRVKEIEEESKDKNYNIWTK